MLLSAADPSLAVRVNDETLTGTINGSNVVFTTDKPFSPGSERVYFNGLRQQEGADSDYVRSESGGAGTGFDTITLAVAPRTRVGRPSDSVTIDYDPV